MRNVVARTIDDVKPQILSEVEGVLDSCMQAAHAGASAAELEPSLVRGLALPVRRMIALVLACACRGAFLRDIEARGLTPAQVKLRTDKSGYATVHTAAGPVTFPIFAYLDSSTPLPVTRSPAREILPYHRDCRSSPLSLQWEARLAAHFPFRKAEELFKFFTNGAATIEDTTISHHVLVIGSMVEPSWLYQTPEEIRRILNERATRDKKTNRPLLYLSSDAHALRRYVGETWATEWKMTNGIRVWCEDAATGKIIHLGGEFLWGDCREVGRRIQALLDDGVLPNGDEAWQAVNPQIVFVSDGTEWLTEHVIPLLGDVVVILDPYHLIDWFAAFARVVLGIGTDETKELHAKLNLVLFGKQPRRTGTAPRVRRGHKKKRGARREHAHDRKNLRRGRPRTVTSDVTTKGLIDLLYSIKLHTPEQEQAREALVERLANNALRTDYAVHLARGMQIGSGPMESMHRSGSQQRLKLAGAKWREESSLAILRFRMLELSGRWEEFWARVDLVPWLAKAFREAPKRHRAPAGVEICPT